MRSQSYELSYMVKISEYGRPCEADFTYQNVRIVNEYTISVCKDVCVCACVEEGRLYVRVCISVCVRACVRARVCVCV